MTAEAAEAALMLEATVEQEAAVHADTLDAPEHEESALRTLPPLLLVAYERALS